MEPNISVIGKKFLEKVRVALLIMKKGFNSKRKLMLDLHVMMKRGKITGKALQNLMFRNHRISFTAVPGDYEFSCTNTPQYIFPFNNKRKHNNYSHFFSCAHAPPTTDDIITVEAVVKALEMLNSQAASLALPGFGRSPLVGQLRITDSPFPIRDIDEEDNQVDEAAEKFIAKFYNDLRQQNNMASR